MTETALPLHSSKEELVERFSDFFIKKINKIRSDLFIKQESLTCVDPDPAVLSGTPFSVFPPVTEQDPATKSCPLDPKPTWLLKENLDVLLPSLTYLINNSLLCAEMPAEYKDAIVIPILKKYSLPPDNLRNFRPVSILPYISKVIEKVVALQLLQHLSLNNIEEKFQSAYKQFHSTETATIRVYNDILRELDQKNCVLLVLLDLSAAFDTIDHGILLGNLQSRFGLEGDVLSWFRSYLENRHQCIFIGGCCSGRRCLICGFPQGSVLGPLLYLLYVFGLGDILRKHGINYHFYADDNQLYLAFSPHVPGEPDNAIFKLKHCATDIRNWMTVHFLKLHEDKTEFIIFSPSNCPLSFSSMTITVGDDVVPPVSIVRNLGSFFDEHLSMDHQLRRIRYIRKYITADTTERLLHAFVTSKLDINNGLLYGLPSYRIKSLQHVQNAAVRLITGKGRFDYITPARQSLHWPPVKSRIFLRSAYWYISASTDWLRST